MLGPSVSTWVLITQLLFTCEARHPPRVCSRSDGRRGSADMAAAPLPFFRFTLHHLRGDVSEILSCALCLERTKRLCSRSLILEGGPKKLNFGEPLLDAAGLRAPLPPRQTQSSLPCSFDPTYCISVIVQALGNRRNAPFVWFYSCYDSGWWVAYSSWR